MKILKNIAPSPQHERGDEEKNIEPKSRCNKYTHCSRNFKAQVFYSRSLF